MEEQKTFMIVDDDRDDCEFFCEAVAELNPSAVCIISTNGEDALMKLRRMIHLPDFIFMDLNMPRMDGKKCLMEMKKDVKLKDIPVVIYSTSSSQLDKDETSKLGATYFLTKPVDFNTLGSKILSVIEKISSTLLL